MNVNFFLAIFWFCVGVGLIGYHWLNPDEPFLRLRGTDASPGWFAIVLALWNLVRWWSTRTRDLEQSYQDETSSRRQRERYSTFRNAEELNPELDFSKPPPKVEEPSPKQGEGGEQGSGKG